MGAEMVSLSSEFEKEAKKNKIGSTCDSDIGYPTGFLNIDYRNARYAFGKKDEELYKYIVFGITDGSMSTLIGRTGCGKSTIALQIASNIIRPFINRGGLILHDDIEAGVVLERKMDLLKMDDKTFNMCYKGRNEGITAENFFSRIKLLADIKTSNYDKYSYDTGHYDRLGNKIIKLVPSVYILDSLAYLMPEKYANEEELSGNFSAASAARVNTGIFKRIIPLCKKANIILITINHILDDISDRPKKAQLPYLKMGETLPGGKTANYSASNMFRINDGGKLIVGESKGEGNYDIDGNVSMFEILKSRTNKSGKSVPLLFNQEIGFDHIMSLFTLLKKNKMLSGGGRSFYITGHDEIKFSQKDFKKKYIENKELRKITIIECVKILEPFIANPIEVNDSDDEREDLNDTLSLLSLIEN